MFVLRLVPETKGGRNSERFGSRAHLADLDTTGLVDGPSIRLDDDENDENDESGANNIGGATVVSRIGFGR